MAPRGQPQPASVESHFPPFIASCLHLVKPNGVIVGREIAETIRPHYPSLQSAVPPTETTGPCYLAGIDGRRPIRHCDVAEFLKDFGEKIHTMGVRRGHRVAVILPNGPELALAILAVSNAASCVPLSATSAVSELKADLQRCGADLVIGPYSAGPLPKPSQKLVDEPHLQELAATYAVMGPSRDWTVFQHVQETANELKIPFVALVPDPDCAGPFGLWTPPARRSSQRRLSETAFDFATIAESPNGILIEQDNVNESQFKPNTTEDEALVLFTSGTTGNKKLVPHLLGDILTAAATIALSWELSVKDVNCNLMPLFHVGGIIRQVFSPLVSGGAVICCPSFDADLFWGLLQRKSFNWYYAAPTMHQIILQTGKAVVGESYKSYRLRMIANAAGGLLPSLAVELRETFGANVLPSYGMTEAMPISSPPANYALDRPGTSGVPVGPEVAILNTQTLEHLPAGTEGPICVRGEPTFRGYGVLANDPTASKPDSFLEEGWFNTGDLGFLDEDGYLYITGRSKEVINRGGEIISPMEVEEAVLAHPDVRACAAFSASHNVLQEIVGIVVVPEDGRPRLDLPSLQTFVADKLATPKWPQCLVFMEGGLPKSHTNKLLRVKLGGRLGLPEFTDEMSPWARTFEAQCPEQGTPLSASIKCEAISVDAQKVQDTLRAAINSDAVWIVPYPGRPGALVAHVGEAEVDRLQFITLATEKLNRYEVPTHVCLVSSAQISVESLSKAVPNPRDAVSSILSSSSQNTAGNGEADPVVEQIQDIYLDLLDLDFVPAADANFFQIGGSSMRASQLASKVRKTFGIACSGAEIFHHATCKDLAELIRSRTEGLSNDHAKASSTDGRGGHPETSTNRDSHDAPFAPVALAPKPSFGSSLIQLLPMFVIFPVWQIFRYLLFFTVLLEKSQFLSKMTDRDMITFLAAYFMFEIVWVTVAPLFLIPIKWIVIGRYREGSFPIWGGYYLRWWLVDVCRKIIPLGLYGYTDVTLRWYFRMLGANIEPGARINLSCELAEFDLVTIGRNAAVELCTLRAFGVDNGAMILGRVRVGHESSVGIRSVVAPYTSVPDGEHLGQATTTYDVTPEKALNAKHASVNREFFPAPSLFTQIFIGWPITFLVSAFGQIPPMMILYSLLWLKSRENSENFFANWNELMDWLCDPVRIPFFFAIRLARALLTPFFYMFAALICKKLIIGRIEPGIRGNSEWAKLRYWLAATLFPRKKVQAVADLIGRHYENVSILYRLLGAKVGKRVFWPGSQPVCNGMFDLLEIGDDVVFGSRSTLLCESTDSFEKIILCAGANVSDNCVVLPGTVVGKNAVLGSNSVAPRGSYLPAGSVWFGSAGCEANCLEKGDGSEGMFYQPLAEETGGNLIASEALDTARLPMQGDETTLRPFGKAFYLKKAHGYRPLGLPAIVLYTWFTRIFNSIFHTLTLVAAIQFGAVLLYSDHMFRTAFRSFTGRQFTQQIDFNDGVNHDFFMGFLRNFDNDGHHHSFLEVYVAVLVAFLFTHFVRVVLWLLIELSAKWCFMGRRKPGRYNYDSSNYGQRWELYQLTAKIRKISRLNLLQFISGTPFMNAYIRWNGGKVGRNCCLYPAGADPFMPEPDLVTIGDNCVVDKASIVCHLNTRGNFELAPIVIERNCTLRHRSRVQQAVHMEAGSQLLERSIAMTGEVIDGRSVWQGAPATIWFRHPEESWTFIPPELNKKLEDDSSKEDIELGPVITGRSVQC